MGRGLLVIAAALLLAVQVVRNAAVNALGERSPDAAARMWSGHPDAELGLGMTGIGRAAREGKPVPSQVFAMMSDAAAKAPLAPEPFLVRGVQAQLEGDGVLSARAFMAAEKRDPRSLPAHYFLADRFFRMGDARRGLAEAAALARLAPGGVTSMAPYVAAYAKDRRTWPQLRDIFSLNSDLQSAALGAMAADPSNADAIMALADEQHRLPGTGWVPILLGRLVEAGEYGKAREVWAAVSRVQASPGQTIYDAAFSDRSAPPPFNWELMSSGVGLAERQPGGRLHVIFYGQQDGLLARQLLLLKPGAYRLSMAVSGSLAGGSGLTWSIRCDRTQSPLSAARLDAVVRQGWSFVVPSGCVAQWLELTGVSADVPQQADFTISALKLEREVPRG